MCLNHVLVFEPTLFYVDIFYFGIVNHVFIVVKSTDYAIMHSLPVVSLEQDLHKALLILLQDKKDPYFKSHPRH